MKHVSNDWYLDDDCMVNQTLTDIQDPSIQIFTETAKANNQKLVDARSSDGLV